MQVKCTTNIFQLLQLVCVCVVSSQQKLHLQQLECLGIFKNTGSSQLLTLANTTCTFSWPTPPSEVPSPRRSQSFAKPSVGRPFSLGNPLREKKHFCFWCHYDVEMGCPCLKMGCILLSKQYSHSPAPLFFHPRCKISTNMLIRLGGVSVKILGGRMLCAFFWTTDCFEHNLSTIVRSLLEIRQGTTGEAP